MKNNKSSARCLSDVYSPVSRSQLSFRFTLIILLLSILSLISLNATEQKWPYKFSTSEEAISIFEPEIEEKDGQISARAAFSVKKNNANPVFGAIWFSSDNIESNKVITFENIKVLQVKIAKIEEKEIDALVKRIETTLQTKKISVDKQILSQNNNLKHNPPLVFFRQKHAVLINIDGKPKLEDIAETSIQAVVNTPHYMVFHNKTYYLRVADRWYRSFEFDGKWTKTEASSDVQKHFNSIDQSKLAEVDNTLINPEIIISTSPAELIYCNGPIHYSTIPETDLLYVVNSESDIIMDISTQHYYVLLSGRWYRNLTLEVKDNWEYVSADKLPETFKKIPKNNKKATVRSHIAGTNEANDAGLSNHVPETRRIDRASKVELEVNYRGDADFVRISDLDCYYAANANYDVIRHGSRYYLCHNGIWYSSLNAYNGWTYCTSVPYVIYRIPASCPIYRVRYVKVYDYGHDYVYYGYTPGYYGSYYCGSTIVYGTGYRYNCWYNNHYYYRPWTWGVSVRYNYPSSRWSYSIGYSNYGWSIGIGYSYGYNHYYYRHHKYRTCYRRNYYRHKHHRHNHYRHHKYYHTTKYHKKDYHHHTKTDHTYHKYAHLNSSKTFRKTNYSTYTKSYHKNHTYHKESYSQKAPKHEGYHNKYYETNKSYTTQKTYQKTPLNNKGANSKSKIFSERNKFVLDRQNQKMNQTTKNKSYINKSYSTEKTNPVYTNKTYERNSQKTVINKPVPKTITNNTYTYKSRQTSPLTRNDSQTSKSYTTTRSYKSKSTIGKNYNKSYSTGSSKTVTTPSKTYSNKTYSNKTYSNKTYTPSQSNKTYSNKTYTNKTYENNSSKTYSNKTYSNKTYRLTTPSKTQKSTPSYSNKSYSNKTYSNKSYRLTTPSKTSRSNSYSNKSYSNKTSPSYSNKSYSNQSYSNKSSSYSNKSSESSKSSSSSSRYIMNKSSKRSSYNKSSSSSSSKLTRPGPSKRR